MKASGWNIRPSCASSVKTGRNETVMMSRLKNSGGPDFAAGGDDGTRSRGSPGFSRSRCLWAFSIITIAASTMAPIAIAMPPRLMMLELSPSTCIAMKAISTPIGSMMIATRALRTCSRNTMQTERDDDAFLDQRAPQRIDGAMDQVGTVVDRLKR